MRVRPKAASLKLFGGVVSEGIGPSFRVYLYDVSRYDMVAVDAGGFRAAIAAPVDSGLFGDGELGDNVGFDRQTFFEGCKGDPLVVTMHALQVFVSEWERPQSVGLDVVKA